MTIITLSCYAGIIYFYVQRLLRIKLREPQIQIQRFFLSKNFYIRKKIFYKY